MTRGFGLLVVAGLGCGSSIGAGDVSLRWKFADGRTCAEAGVATVAVRIDGHDAGTFDCYEGQAPSSITIRASAEVHTFALAAQTAVGTALYRGELHTDTAVTKAEITLFYTGGR